MKRRGNRHRPEEAAPNDSSRGASGTKAPPIDPSESIAVRDKTEHPVISKGVSGAGPRSERLVSLDAFRGLSILGMWLVNNAALGPATPSWLVHAPWHGVRAADLVFPWFLLIVGVAIPFSSRARSGAGSAVYARRVAARVAALVALGILIDSCLARRLMPGLGVLQLIGLAYGIGAAMSVLTVFPRAVLITAILLAHGAAILYLPVPGVGTGFLSQNANLIDYLNRRYLAGVYLRGAVSLFPTSALVAIGTLMGDRLRHWSTPSKRFDVVPFLSGAVLVLAGVLWSRSLPLNKSLWTGSYILFCAGTGTVVLALFHETFDRRGSRRLAFPLVVLGANAIAAYVIPILVKVCILRVWTVPASAGGRITLQDTLLRACTTRWGYTTGGWFYTLAFMLFWWCVFYIAYRRCIFLKV